MSSAIPHCKQIHCLLPPFTLTVKKPRNLLRRVHVLDRRFNYRATIKLSYPPPGEVEKYKWTIPRSPLYLNRVIN